MGIMGKLVGGTIGFAIGGPLGAIAGAAFGHAYDTGVDAYYSETGGAERLTSEQTSQATFFVAAFSMLAKLVRADGRISKEEIDTIERFMLEDLRLDPQSRQYAMNIFHAALESPVSFEDFAGQFFQHFRNQPQMLDLMIDILFRVSVSDGNITREEEQIVLSAVHTFQIADERYRQIKSRYVRDVDKFYAILGCSKSDSDDEIKRQYRKRVSEYHPDKIASKGLPEEFTQFAADKFREIQEAYETIKSERGIK